MKSIALAALMIATVSRGADTFQTLKTKDGAVYTNVEISSVTAAYAIVFYGEGSGAKIALTNLPDELQRKYHFDPAKSQQEQDQIERRNQARHDAQLATQEAQIEAQNEKLYRWVEGKMVPITSFSAAYGKIVRVLKNGILLGPWQDKIGGFVAGGMVTRDSRIPRDLTVFVQCPIGGLADGQVWNGYCYRVGTLSVDGRTLEKYDTGLSYTDRSSAVMTRSPIDLAEQRRIRQYLIDHPELQSKHNK